LRQKKEKKEKEKRKRKTHATSKGKAGALGLRLAAIYPIGGRLRLRCENNPHCRNSIRALKAQDLSQVYRIEGHTGQWWIGSKGR
jgi:hypothetical protein